MRKSWKSALEKNFDGYLLINDDTIINSNLFDEILNTHNFSKSEYEIPGIYVGSTKDPFTNERTYGGAKLTNKFLFKYEKLSPSGNVQECDLGNANIMYVPNKIVEKIGILNDGYIHGAADYDYTLKAKKNKIPVLITPNYCGKCVNDHPNLYLKFREVNIKKRIRILLSPTGLAFRDQLRFMRRYFPFRLPFILISGLLKIIFPKLYVFFKSD
jgi:GT2 family glycosyltransferase